MRIRTITILTALIILLLPTLASAAGAGAISLTFNVSARAEGMGGAGVAGVWGGDTDVWANPALLAFRPGVRYSTMHSQLAVGLADDIYIDKQELTFGWRGIGVLYAESPFDHVDLDMGTQQATDENGQPIGTFQSWEKSHAWGVGVGLTQVLDSFGGTDLNRWFDVAGGVVWRTFEDNLAPASVLQDPNGGSAKASSHDLGWVARVTPLDTDAMDSPLADLPLGLRLEGTYGKAKQNATDEYIVHVDQNQSDPMPTQYVKGWAVHTEILPGEWLTGVLPPVMRDVVSSLFAWTYSEQTIEPGYIWDGTDYVYAHDTSGQYDEKGRGHELSFLNVFFIRRGHLTIDYGDIDAPTKGWGLNLPVGRYGGVRYDEATVPQAAGLPTVDRSGWHVWVDVAAILGAE